MQSNIIYTGNVMITIDNKNPKKKKNTGTKHLFAAITGFLGGLFNTPSLTARYAPCCIQIIEGEVSTEDTALIYNTDYAARSILSKELTVVKRTRKDSTITLSALLTNSHILERFKDVDSTCSFLLLDGEKRILAMSSFNKADIQDVKNNVYAQAVIDWSLTFGNNTSIEGDNE